MISSFVFQILIISVTSGFQFVRVPVLSKTIMSISFVFSNVSAFFISIPLFAQTHVHTIIAVGVASQSAQGQAITRAVTAGTIDSLILQVIKYQTINVSIETTIITGTKTHEILSAKCSIGAFELCALSTNFIIFARVQFSFVLLTFTFIFQSKFIVDQKHSLHISL
ncbi:MAG: hypothetical protein P1U46_03840 [Patescibacteria group bacterium]|nr:hypothetical protein [Patescibacteria group bacterium]